MVTGFQVPGSAGKNNRVDSKGGGSANSLTHNPEVSRISEIDGRPAETSLFREPGLSGRSHPTATVKAGGEVIIMTLLHMAYGGLYPF